MSARKFFESDEDYATYLDQEAECKEQCLEDQKNEESFLVIIKALAKSFHSGIFKKS